VAYELGMQIVLHPPLDDSKRAFKLRPSTRVLQPRAYLRRNLDIVDACDALIAAPAQKAEQVRSGTWATWRAAQQRGVVTFLVYPDGCLDGRDMRLDVPFEEVMAMARQGRLL
jgi:hypothetical protein